MGKRKYRTVAAAVLAGAVLFSPLLCGMTRLELKRIRPSTATEMASPAGDLAAEFAGSALVGCVLSQVVSRIDFSEWADRVDAGTWVWIGMKVLRMTGGMWRGDVLWM